MEKLDDDEKLESVLLVHLKLQESVALEAKITKEREKVIVQVPDENEGGKGESDGGGEGEEVKGSHQRGWRKHQLPALIQKKDALSRLSLTREDITFLEENTLYSEDQVREAFRYAIGTKGDPKKVDQAFT